MLTSILLVGALISKHQQYQHRSYLHYDHYEEEGRYVQQHIDQQDIIILFLLLIYQVSGKGYFILNTNIPFIPCCRKYIHISYTFYYCAYIEILQWNVEQAISKHLKFKMPRPGDLNQLANCYNRRLRNNRTHFRLHVLLRLS